MEWCEVFKTGTHTDASGKQRNWTVDDLDRIVTKFNEKKPNVPAVIGHPKTNNPAYGWVKAFKREGEKLLASYKSVVPEFAEWVNKGLYPNRSISLYEDLTPRHIGFLGAVPPAVKGLEAYQFAEDEKCMTYEFSDDTNYKFQTIAETLQNLREFLIDKYSLEIADKVISNWKLDDLKNIEEKTEEEIKAFCEAITIPQTVQEKEQDLNKPKDEIEIVENPAPQEFAEQITQKNEEIAELKAKLEAEKLEKRKVEFLQFAEGLLKDGCITPAQKTTVIDFMEVCHNQGQYEFSEGEEKSVLTRFKDMLKSFKQVNFSEISTDTNTNPNIKAKIDFSETKTASKLIAEKAKQDNISVIEAKELLKGGM